MSSIPGREIAEGNVVSYTTGDGQEDTARVRRVYDKSLELVNHDRGYQIVERECVSDIVGDIIPGTYTCWPK